MTRFLAFDIEKYDRSALAQMTDEELAALEQKDPEIESYTPAEIAEALNDEATFTEVWIFPLDENFV